MSHVITCKESWFYLNYYFDETYLEDCEIFKIPKMMISDLKNLVFSTFSYEELALLEKMPNSTKFNSDYMCDSILSKTQTKLSIKI